MEKSRNSSNSMNQGLSEIPEQVDVRFAIKLETYIYGQISKENWTHMLRQYITTSLKNLQLKIRNILFFSKINDGNYWIERKNRQKGNSLYLYHDTVTQP